MSQGVNRSHTRFVVQKPAQVAGDVQSNAEGAAGIKVPGPATRAWHMNLVDSVGTGTSVRPGRNRSQPKTEMNEKIKKPVENVRKKPPAARKAPARGRYVDEYARPGV